MKQSFIDSLQHRVLARAMWWCGGVAVWWCGGVVVWWCGGVVV
jgi:hypothetical protein